MLADSPDSPVSSLPGAFLAPGIVKLKEGLGHGGLVGDGQHGHPAARATNSPG